MQGPLLLRALESYITALEQAHQCAEGKLSELRRMESSRADPSGDP